MKKIEEKNLMPHIMSVRAPVMMLIARGFIGTREKIGPENNPTIMGWANYLNVPYAGDDVPWCGLFMGYVAAMSNKALPKGPLVRASTWLNFGKPVGKDGPKLGDVLIFHRNGGGHVGLYCAEDNFFYYVLGGNQSDSVRISPYAKSRLLDARNEYRLGQPAECQKIIIN